MTIKDEQKNPIDEAFIRLATTIDEKIIQLAETIDEEILNSYYKIQSIIKSLSFTERRGKWIDVNGDGSLWRCDQCKNTACCKGDYCPDCGARMEIEEK